MQHGLVRHKAESRHYFFEIVATAHQVKFTVTRLYFTNQCILKLKTTMKLTICTYDEIWPNDWMNERNGGRSNFYR